MLEQVGKVKLLKDGEVIVEENEKGNEMCVIKEPIVWEMIERIGQRIKETNNKIQKLIA